MKITELRLYCNNTRPLKDFYVNKLGLDPLIDSDHNVKFKIGSSELTFLSDIGIEAPYYHFAFNIPENQMNEAIYWLNKKTKLIEYEGSPVIDFPNWNAHSVYFYDPAGNIVELIARHNINTSSNDPFSAASLLNISEIGMPVDSVKEFVELTKDKLNEKLWWGNLETFAAIGDEEALFIAVTAKRNWFPTEKPCNIYPLSVKIHKDNMLPVKIDYSNYSFILGK